MKIYIAILILLIGILALPLIYFAKIPISIECLVSFWGSYLGGFYTIVAVLITVYQTRKIQAEQKQVLDKNERNNFSNNIADLVARYITNISKYYYDQSPTGHLPSNIPAKTEANQCYFTLRIKLNRIESAKAILIILEEIHKHYSIRKSADNSIFKNSIGLLEQEASRFIDNYCS
jgi:hypothetical protein